MAANLYAKSIFGEDALANVSVEKPMQPEAPVTGHIRIRAKSQVGIVRINCQFSKKTVHTYNYCIPYSGANTFYPSAKTLADRCCRHNDVRPSVCPSIQLLLPR